MLSSAGLYFKNPDWLFGVFDWPLALLGPCYYLYVRAITGLTNGRAQAIHFIVPALWTAGLLGARLVFAPRPLFAFMTSETFGLILLAFELSVIAYAAASLVRLWRYRQLVRTLFSSTQKRDLNWLVWLSTLLIVLLVLWVPANLFGGLWGWLLVFGRLLMLYLGGWYGLHQTGVVLAAPEQLALAAAREPALPASAEGGKYARSGMSEAAADLIGERLARRETTERDFLDNDLKLTDLAERIGTSPQLLSQYLNHVLGQSFFDYINGLRVAEAMRLMTTPMPARRPLLELAFEAGFNSKSTFNTTFKKITGMAPSEWRRQNDGASAPIG